MGEMLWIPISQVIQPKNRYATYVNHFWVAKDECVAVWRNDWDECIPQANVNKKIVERFLQYHPGSYLEFLYVSYLPSLFC